MLYKLVKIPARLAIKLYCRKIIINKKDVLSSSGPLLIASNHPNSFLDAIIIATLFDQPVYSLTRGDTFKNKFVASILTALKMLPVYRMSEGAENLEQNYDTFDRCKEIFEQKGIVLIFSEGRCVNEWKLRPLKKGTARLAISSWNAGIDLAILPTGINYQSFTKFGKNVQLNFGDIISQKDISINNGYGNAINEFNDVLKEKLKQLVIEVEPTDKNKIAQVFYTKQSGLKKVILFLPSLGGLLSHFILYFPVKMFSNKYAGKNDHYDSVMVGLLFILYPLYMVLIAVLISLITPNYWWILTFILLPFCAWSLVQIKNQF